MARPKLVWIRKATPSDRFDCQNPLDSCTVDAKKPDSAPTVEGVDQNQPEAPPEVEQQAVLQHTVLPQNLMDVEHSGSFMKFLRASGPVIPVDQVIELSDGDSSSSSDATSPLVDEEALKFMVANKLCADQLFCSSNGLLDGFTMSVTYPLLLNGPNAISVQLPVTASTIVLDKSIFSTQRSDEAFVPNGFDLVPWRPVVHAVMLKVLAENLQRREVSTVIPTVQTATHLQNDGLNAISFNLGDGAQGPGSSGLAAFQMDQFQPSPPALRGQNEMSVRAQNVVSLPTTVSNPSSPLVEGNVNDGFCPVRLSKVQIWPAVVAAWRKPRQHVAPVPTPPLILDEGGIVHSVQSGPSNLKFQTEEIRPSPVAARGRMTSDVRQKRKNMCLPEVASSSDARTPLAQKSVRRSLRRANSEGFCEVRIDKEPSKRCKNWLVQIDEATGQSGPLSISVLQGWGVKCGVDPSDLTEDALLQAPSLQVPNEENE